MSLRVSFPARLASFFRRQDGAATIEAVLWLPMFFYVMALAIDTTMIFHGYSRVVRAVEDVNRGLSVGRIKTIDEGKAKLAATLSDYKNLRMEIGVSSDNVIVSNVEVPVTSLIFLGAIKPIVGKGISIRTQQYKEF